MNYFKTFTKACLLVSTLVGSTACSTMQTETAAMSEPVSGKGKIGNYYFLPRGIIRVVGEPDQDKGYKITISRFNVPDITARYFLKQNLNPFFNDHTVLEVDDQGLLTTTNVESEDETPEVIDKVTETVINVAKIAANLGGTPLAQDAESMAAPQLPLPFNCTFDPLVKSEVEAAKSKVFSAGFILGVSDSNGDKNSSALQSTDYPNAAYTIDRRG